MFQLQRINEGSYRITTKNGKKSMLSRYGFLSENAQKSYGSCIVTIENNFVKFKNEKKDVSISVNNCDGKGFQVVIPLDVEERLFGMGDANRDNVMLRGKTINVWVANVASYGPMPVLLSSSGWALIVNSTYSQKFDIGETDKDKLIVSVAGGDADFYLVSAENLLGLVQAVTDITGKPTMLPKYGYGLTFVENERTTDARQLLDDIRMMRDRKIPCDVFGLEPSWMEEHYDLSTEKQWSSERFWIPPWLPAGHHRTFLGPIRFMGMQLSLWLCEDYDLFYEEDRLEKVSDSVAFIDENEDQASILKNVDFLDPHIKGAVKSDTITKEDEPWFEHLKKFVDDGASCFKLDGCRQVMTHPQRLWGGKYLDEEAHNIYPLVLAKQMKEGFQQYTDRRGLIYTAGAYVGTQRYAATWAGDTGGGPRTLVACLNYAMCGHTNTTCDMDVMDLHAVHYAFLSTWTQICSWAYYVHPWFLPEEQEAAIRRYSQLRSELFPYLYTTAHNASVTGIPVMRPLPMVYGETASYDDVKNAYMLGDYLYVGAFDMHLKLPKGKWIDYFSGKVYEGDTEYDIPEGYGGALLVKQGAIIPTMLPQQYLLEKEHDYIIRVYTGESAEAVLYEDDGYTYDYEKGGYAETKFIWTESAKDGKLCVKRRSGDFAGRVDNGHNPIKNAIPKIDGIHPVRDMEIRLYGRVPAKVTVNGELVKTSVCAGYVTFTLPAALHENSDVVYCVEYE